MKYNPQATIQTACKPSEDGVLWFINQSLFWPMGYALAMTGTGEEWSLIGDGNEPIRATDQEAGVQMHAFKDLCDRHSNNMDAAKNQAPADEVPDDGEEPGNVRIVSYTVWGLSSSKVHTMVLNDGEEDDTIAEDSLSIRKVNPSQNKWTVIVHYAFGHWTRYERSEEGL